MEINYYKEYSKSLNRDMEYKVFGTSGKICLAFAPQNGRFYDFENFGMVDVVAPEIEAGKLQVVLVDSIDTETWSDQNGNPRYRMEQHERWFNYVINELIPTLKKRNKYRGKLMATGCSMGGFHSANFFFRRPDIFDTVVALSGFYNASFFMGGYQDDLTYINSPIDCIPNLSIAHPYMDLYRNSNIIICVGQGAWEDRLLDSTRWFDSILQMKGIKAWVDYWGKDVNHDWPWWRKQLRYFVDKLEEKKAL